MKTMNTLQVYLIHCKKYPERLDRSMSTLLSLGYEPEIVTDEPHIITTTKRLESNNTHWEEAVKNAGKIFLKNAGLPSNGTCHFMKPRKLLMSEYSLLHKFVIALRDFLGNTSSQFALFAEDDIQYKEGAAAAISRVLEYALYFHANDHLYIDIAGGLVLPSFEGDMILKKDGLIRLKTARTNTTACFLLSRSMAYHVKENMERLNLPADINLQTTLSSLNNINCYWSLPTILIHGSKVGTYRSTI